MKKLTRRRSILGAGLAAAILAMPAFAQQGPDTPPEVVNPNIVSFDLESATLEELQLAMDRGVLTSVELVNLYLKRIYTYDTFGPPFLQSVLAINPNLMEEAQEADRLRASGVKLGPLHGIPFMVKGAVSVKGMATTNGANGWRGLVAQDENWAVKKLREAGAVVMGHANQDTWQSSATTSTSQVAGTVRSPYLDGANPGGSSGGSGVATGAWMTFFAFGGETGGSIRNPGDRNLLVAYKVSGGSISIDKTPALVPERDVIGPMTRNAIDNAMVRDAVGPINPDDFWTPMHQYLTDKFPVPTGGFAEAAKEATLEGKKIGVIGTYVGLTHPDPGTGATSNTTGVQTTTPATQALVAAAMDEMRAMGAEVDYVFLPPAASTTFVRPDGSPVTRLLSTPFSTNVNAGSYRATLEAIVPRESDDLQTLGTAVRYWADQVTNVSNATRDLFYNTTVVDGTTIIVDRDTAATDFNFPEGIEHFQARAEQKNGLESWMDENGIDALVWPNWPNKGPTTGTIIARDLVNFMHLPAVTVPAGILQYTETTREGLTLNFAGRIYDDQRVLALAHAYEQGTKHRFSPPLAPALPGESFSFARVAPVAPTPAPIVFAPPVVNAFPAARLIGRGAAARVGFSGVITDESGSAEIEVFVNGRPAPVVVDGEAWTAILPAARFRPLLRAGTRTVVVVVQAKDASGNVSADRQIVRIPPGAAGV